VTTYSPNDQRVDVPGRSRMLPPHVILRRALTAHPNRDFVMYFGTPHARTIRYCAAGTRFDIDDEYAVETLRSGVYLRATVQRGEEPVSHRSLFLCCVDDLESLITMDQPDVGELEVQGLAVAASYWAAMLSSSSAYPTT